MSSPRTTPLDGGGLMAVSNPSTHLIAIKCVQGNVAVDQVYLKGARAVTVPPKLWGGTEWTKCISEWAKIKNLPKMTDICHFFLTWWEESGVEPSYTPCPQPPW